MLTDILRRYQSYNEETGKFDQPRMLTEYAALLGLNYVYLSQMYSGSRNPGMETFIKLTRAFPGAQEDIGQQLAAALAAAPDVQKQAVA